MEFPNETSLKELLRILRRSLLPAAVVALLLGAATYYLRGLAPPTYMAATTLVLSQGNTPASAIGITLLTSPVIDVRAYRSAVESPAMLNEALMALGVEQPTSRDRSALLGQLSVGIEQTPVSSLIHIEAYSDTAAGSKRVVDAVTEALISWDQQRAVRSLDGIVETLESQIQALTEQVRIGQTTNEDQGRVNALLTSQNALIQQRDAARALRTSAIGRLEVLSPSIEPEVPLGTGQTLYSLVAAMLGAVGVVAISLVRNALDSRMRSSDEFFAVTGVPVLAEFSMPRKPSQLISLEEANYLGAGLSYGRSSEEPKVILVTSVEGGEGSASVAFGLAASIASNAQNVLLVDADLRNPVSAEAFGLPFGGLTSIDEYLGNPRMTLVPGDHRMRTSPYLHVVPGYRPVSNASALLVRGFRQRAEEWGSAFDVVIVHAPPLLSVADGLIVAPHCTGVLLVCNLKVTNRNRVKRAMQLLERLDVRVLGAATSGWHGENDAGAPAATKLPQVRIRHRVPEAATRRR